MAVRPGASALPSTIRWSSIDQHGAELGTGGARGNEGLGRGRPAQRDQLAQKRQLLLDRRFVGGRILKHDALRTCCINTTPAASQGCHRTAFRPPAYSGGRGVKKP